jgi:hypothetical protein
MARAGRPSYPGAMVYREQVFREPEFVERCACNAPSTGPCASCGRPWCAVHRKGTMCYRCADVIERELGARAGQRWTAALTTWAVVAIGLCIAHTVVGIVLGAPLAFGVYFATRTLQRRLITARMAPRLASTTGEIIPLRDTALPFESSTVMPVSGMGGYR